MQRFTLGALAFVALVGLGLSGVRLASADEPVNKQLYGAGVHAYFAKDYKEANDLLSTAEAGKTDDPRVFYFRGLARWQLGRPDEAKQDFEKAATLEATASDDVYSVDKALERIQGKARLAIEDARLAAKNKAAKRRITEKEERYNRIRTNEPNVLEGLTPAPPKPAPKKPEGAEPDAPKKPAEPPKEGAEEGGAKESPKEGAKEGGAKPDPAEGTAEFDPLREKPVPVTPRKGVAGDPKPAEPKPLPKEPEAKPAEPKVAAKPMPKDEPRPASPSGKKSTTALARIIGKVAQQYADDVAGSLPPLPTPGVAPPPVPKVKQ